MEDTDDLVDGLLIDRDTGIFLVSGDVHDLVVARIDRKCDDLLSVRHDLHNILVVELEDVLDHLLLGILDGALFRTDIDHHADLFFCDVGLLDLRIDMQKP